MRATEPDPSSRYIKRTVRGSSMDRAGIVPGTVVYIDPELGPRHGDLVAASVPPKGDTIKRLREARGGGRVASRWLMPESSNKKWKPTLITDEVTVLGVVVAYLPPGATKLVRDVSGGHRPPAPVVQMVDALAASMLVGHALAQKEHPPLAYYLLTMRHRVWEVRRAAIDHGGTLRVTDVPLEYNRPEMADMLGFARALGMDEPAWQMVLAGYVPEEAWLIKFAKRLTQLIGEEVPAAELLRFTGGKEDQ